MIQFSATVPTFNPGIKIINRNFLKDPTLYFFYNAYTFSLRIIYVIRIARKG